MITIKRYKDRQPRVKEYLGNIIDSIQNDLSDVPDEYAISLDLIADTLDIYYKCMDEIKKNGLIVKDSRGGNVKSPAISVLNSTQLFLSKLLSQFGMTRIDKAKIKKLTKEDTSDAFELDNLLND